MFSANLLFRYPWDWLIFVLPTRLARLNTPQTNYCWFERKLKNVRCKFENGSSNSEEFVSIFDGFKGFFFAFHLKCKKIIVFTVDGNSKSTEKRLKVVAYFCLRTSSIVWWILSIWNRCLHFEATVWVSERERKTIHLFV